MKTFLGPQRGRKNQAGNGSTKHSSIAALGALTLLGRAGAAISSPPAGFGDLAREGGREAPAPSQGGSVEQERAHHEHAEVTVRGHPEAATRKERNCYAQRGCDDWIRTA